MYKFKVLFCFLQPVESKNGLLTTVGYQLGKDQPVVYALEVGTIFLSFLISQRPTVNLNDNFAHPDLQIRAPNHKLICHSSIKTFLINVLLLRGGGYIVLASSVHTFCLSRTISQYLLVRFDSFLVQMISTMVSRYPISLVKIDPLSLELLPLF